MKAQFTSKTAKRYRRILAQVNLSSICRQVNVPRRIVYGVLQGESSRYEDLERVVKAACAEIRNSKDNVRRIQGRRATEKATEAEEENA